VSRIALVHDVAGVASVQADLLRRAGHVVDQVRLPSYGAAWRWPAKALALPVRLAAYAPTIARLRRANYDVVHIHWLSHGIVGVLARRPFFAQAHGSDVHVSLDRPVYGWVTRLVLRHATRVFYVTPNLRDPLRDFAGKLVYLPNPVDVEQLGDQAGVPTQVSRVLVFTRLDPIKGIDRIFPAAERLSRLAHLTALDWGPLATRYVRSYRRWVDFVPPMPHEKIGAFLGGFDLVIGQMRQGVLGLMELEALAAGRPLIAALDPSLYGDDSPPVVRVSGEGELVDALARLQQAPAELARLSRLGREWVTRNHGFERHLRLLEAAYFGAPSS
jgi:glycosyltransferase involved in cell wall biosynthesis